MKCYIKHFPDYHQIKDTKKLKSIELGCFPPKNGWCREYFALFYNKGEKIPPKFKDFSKNLYSKVDLSENFLHGVTGNNISISKIEIEYECNEALIRANK